MSSPLAAEAGMPDLRFVAVDALVPHEQHDDQRMQPLVAKLREQGVLKNPPIVAPLDAAAGAERFVVLDGANRCMAARAAGFPHMAVQVVRYEEPFVRLTTWCHALGDYAPEDIERILSHVPGLECRREPLLHARAMLARREAIACVVFADGHADTLHAGGDLHARNRLLNAVVDTYRSKRFVRVTTDSLAAARERHPDVAALVVFPNFEPAEVVELATGGARVPAGITRHLIRWRALRINLPIERLADTTQPLAKKNEWLAGWLREKYATRQVRFYEESTVLFDE